MSIFENANCPTPHEGSLRAINNNYPFGVLTVKTFNTAYSFRVEGGAWSTTITMNGSTSGRRYDACKGLHAGFSNQMFRAITAALYDGERNFDDFIGSRLLMTFRKNSEPDAPMEDGDFDLRTSPVMSIEFVVA